MIRAAGLLFTLFVVTLTLAPQTAGAASPTVVSINIEPFVANIGDRMTLTIVVEHDAGITIAGPGAVADYGALTYIEQAPAVTVAAPVGERTTLTYIFAPFRLGTGTLPPLEITWRGPGVEGTLATPAVPYSIDDVLAPGDDTLLPLKAQFEIPQPAPPPYVPALVVAMFAVLTAAAYRLMRTAIATEPPARVAVPVAVPIDSAEAARAALAAVAAEVDPPAYYAGLTGAVRQYLSARYGFPAYALTRREMEAAMIAAGIDRWPARLTANLLEQGDAVQFAGFRPAGERREQDLDAAYEIIAVTSPTAPDAP